MSPQLLREATPTARKTHRCSLCIGPIKPGEQYARDTLIYDDRIYDWLTCLGCTADRVISYVADWSWGESIDPEIAHEWAAEQVIHGDPDEQRAAKRYLERRADQ